MGALRTSTCSSQSTDTRWLSTPLRRHPDIQFRHGVDEELKQAELLQRCFQVRVLSSPVSTS